MVLSPKRESLPEIDVKACSGVFTTYCLVVPGLDDWQSSEAFASAAVDQFGGSGVSVRRHHVGWDLDVSLPHFYRHFME
jgi:hypothetical protein